MAPVLAQSFLVLSTASNTTTLTTASFTPNIGDVIVVKVVSESNGSTWNVPTDTSGNSYSQRLVDATASQCWAQLATSTVTVSASLTVSVSALSGTPSWHSMIVERWTGASLAGTPATNGTKTGSGAPSSTITTTAANSVISWLNGDFNAVSPAGRTYNTTSATPVEDGIHDKSTGNYVAYYLHQPAATAASQTFGITSPTGQAWTLLGIEILASGGGPAADANQAEVRRPWRIWGRDRSQFRSTYDLFASRDVAAVVTADSLPVLTAPLAAVTAPSAPQPFLAFSRDVTPLQVSASPPLVDVAPPGRPTALAPTVLMARSTADQPSADTPTRPLVAPVVTRPADPVRAVLFADTIPTPVRQDNDFEGQSDGVAVTAPNSDDFGGAALSIVSAGLTYSTAAAAHGTVSCLFNIAGGTATSFDLAAPDSHTSAAVRCYVNLSSLPSVTDAQFPIGLKNAAFGGLGRIEMSTTGQLRIASLGGGTSAYTTTGLSAGVTYRIEWIVSGYGSANTTSTVEFYVGDSLTVADSVSLSGQTTTTLVQRSRWLKMTASPAAAIAGWIDDIAQVLGSSTRIGPVGLLDTTTAPLLVAPRTSSLLSAPPPVILRSTADPTAGSDAPQRIVLPAAPAALPGPVIARLAAARAETAVPEPPVPANVTAATAPRPAPPALLLHSTSDPVASSPAPPPTLAPRALPSTQLAAAAAVLASRDDTALQPSSNPATPLLGRAPWSTTAPPAALTRSTADLTATDSPPRPLLAQSGALAYQAPTAALALSRDVTAPQPSDSPPPPVIGRAPWSTTAAPPLVRRSTAGAPDVPALRMLIARAVRPADVARVFLLRQAPPPPAQRRTDGVLVAAPPRPPGAAQAWLLTPRAEPPTGSQTGYATAGIGATVHAVAGVGLQNPLAQPGGGVQGPASAPGLAIQGPAAAPGTATAPTATGGD